MVPMCFERKSSIKDALYADKLIFYRQSLVNGANDMRLQTDKLVSTGSYSCIGKSDDIPSFARSLYFSLVERRINLDFQLSTPILILDK